MQTAVLLTMGTAGDLVPFFKLASALQRQRVDVILITHCSYAATACRLGIEFDTWDTPEQFDAFIKDGPLLDTPEGMLKFADRHVFSKVGAVIDALDAHCNKPNVTIYARHMLDFAASIVANQRSLSYVSILPSVSHASGFRLWTEYRRLILADRINRVRIERGMPAISNWAAGDDAAHAFLGCWPEWFAAPESTWPERLIPIGFLCSDGIETASLSPDIERALDGDPRELVLITGGTSLWTHAAQFYSTAAKACDIVNRKAILVCPHPDLIPPRLSSGICTAAALPFSLIMHRFAAVIHHGGAGTMVRAMHSETPQLVLPYGGDRVDNARRIQELGIGLCLPVSEWTPPNIANALKRLINNSRVRGACASIRKRISYTPDLEHVLLSIVKA